MSKPDLSRYFFCFAVEDDEGDLYVTITPRAEWDRHGRVNDQSAADGDVEPHGFFAVMESVYEFEGTPEQARDRLLAAGAVENERIATNFGIRPYVFKDAPTAPPGLSAKLSSDQIKALLPGLVVASGATQGYAPRGTTWKRSSKRHEGGLVCRTFALVDGSGLRREVKVWTDAADAKVIRADVAWELGAGRLEERSWIVP